LKIFSSGFLIDNAHQLPESMTSVGQSMGNCADPADIPQMFAKIPQFFMLSFFEKIALPIQAYILEISHTFRSCAFNESF
jgi:hypothetical protein